MDLNQMLEDHARKNPMNLVLAEGEDARTVEAAHNLLKNRTVKKLWVLGNTDKVKKLASDGNFNLDGATLIDPAKAENREAWALKYFEMRNGKTPKEEALEEMKGVITYGCMMTHEGMVDGMVGGATHTTAELIRNAIRIVGPRDGIKTVSSCFVMIMPEPTFGAEGVFIYSDCGAVPNPDPVQLADITISAVDSFRKLVKKDPIVALLSFSTKGSAKHPDVDKVVHACEELKKRNVDFKFDGELQVDAAIIPSVGKSKAPGSDVAGKANVLIFPDLDAGNIAYKITERLGKAIALGPLMQGLKKPVNDLSRGCNAKDVYQVAIITQNQV
jgi:phosphate acetyltransferase